MNKAQLYDSDAGNDHELVLKRIQRNFNLIYDETCIDLESVQYHTEVFVIDLSGRRAVFPDKLRSPRNAGGRRHQGILLRTLARRACSDRDLHSRQGIRLPGCGERVQIACSFIHI